VIRDLERWQGLLSAENPDLLAILKLGAQLQAYFAAVKRNPPSGANNRLTGPVG